MNISSVKTENRRSRSFTSISEILTPTSFKDAFRLGFQNNKQTVSIFRASCLSRYNNTQNMDDSILFNETPYVTSERYHALNKNVSDISVVRSTSTLFYDLDNIIKRHSFQCMTETPLLICKNRKKSTGKPNNTCFMGKSEAIVQECETQVQPKLRIRDSLQTNVRKFKRQSFNDPTLSSDIFLNDDYINQRSNSYAQEKDSRQQKFWSYAKYQTEYTKPKPEKKKCGKKDRGKRTEDPCPCQLFSYACPCTEKKSLTELAKSSKTLTLAEQVTNTSKLVLAEDQIHKNCKLKQSRGNDCYDEKPTNTDFVDYTKKYEVVAATGPATRVPVIRETSKVIDKNLNVKNDIKTKSKPRKRSRQVICPNCREKLDVLSTTEDEDILKAINSPVRNSNESPSPVDNISLKNNIQNDFDTCNHEPPCELVPLCQILPIENVYVNSKCTNKYATAKHNQKSIKVTKACRHHPPCMVVPSCQRMNVLNNNCEYIPPCLHRPRCINLPLCAPFSKTINYDEILSKNAEELNNMEYHLPRCKYYPAYQHDSMNNSVDHQCYNNGTPNICEYVSEYSPRFVMNPKMVSMSTTFSPCQMPSTKLYHCCKSNKSCQYDCAGCKCTASVKQKVKSAISDAVIYIRDVGCQFRYKNFSPRDSIIRSKISSASFELNSTKATNYYTNFNTLRYEDKCTNPISGEELSMSTFTTSSLEIDVHCPSHGKQAVIKRNTGFSPVTNSPFVAALTADANPYCMNDIENEYTSKSDTRTRLNKYPVSSNRSFLKGKYKKALSLRRRRKSKANHVSYSSSRRPQHTQKIF